MTSADSRLAAASNEIRVRVESSKNRLTTVRPRRVGQLLDLARLGDAAMLLGGVEDAARRRRGSGRRRRAGAASRHPRRVGVGRRLGAARPRRAVVLGQLHAAPLGAARSAGSCRRSRPGSAARGGRGRPAPPAARRAAGRGRRARRARPGRCGRRTARRRPARRPCRRCRRRGCRCAPARAAGCSRRSSRYIVMSSEPTGTSRALDLGDPLGQPAGERRRRGSGCRAGRGSRSPCCAPGSRARCGSAPAWMSGAFEHRSGTVHATRPPSPPHWTGR